MYNRREFLRGLSGAAAGIVFTGCGLVDSALGALQAGGPQQAKVKRRKVLVGGRRVLTVDVHNHILVPEVVDLVKNERRAEGFRNQLASAPGFNYNPHNIEARLARMDQEGLDVQAVSINP